MHHVFQLKNNLFNNRDFNIDQKNRDYDNPATLTQTWLVSLEPVDGMVHAVTC